MTRPYDNAANLNEQGYRAFASTGLVAAKAHFTWRAFRETGPPFTIGSPIITLPLPAVYIKHCFWFAFSRDDGLAVATDVRIDIEFSKNKEVTYCQPIVNKTPQVSANDSVWFQPAWAPYMDAVNFFGFNPGPDALHVQHEGFVNFTNGFWILPQYVTCSADRVDVTVRAFNGQTVSCFLAVRSQTHLV